MAAWNFGERESFFDGVWGGSKRKEGLGFRVWGGSKRKEGGGSEGDLLLSLAFAGDCHCFCSALYSS